MFVLYLHLQYRLSFNQVHEALKTRKAKPAYIRWGIVVGSGARQEQLYHHWCFRDFPKSLQE